MTHIIKSVIVTTMSANPYRPSGASKRRRAEIVKTLRDAGLLHGACAICGKVTDLMLDHDHKTEKIRGTLCNECNSGLGLFFDIPELLEKAAGYLRFYKDKI